MVSVFFFDESTLAGALSTIILTIFIAELTDKDALLLLALATRLKPKVVFFAGSTAFAITSAIIVTIGFVISSIFPVFWIKIAGGVIMIGYALWEYFRPGSEKKEEAELSAEEKKLIHRTQTKGMWPVFLSAVSMLIVLDLAGDATEVVTIVFVAHFQNVLLVFLGAVIALVAATAVETAIGNRLGKFFSPARIRLFSFIVFIIIGSIVILTTVFLP